MTTEPLYTISGNYIYGGVIRGATLEWGNSYNRLYMDGSYGVWKGTGIELNAVGVNIESSSGTGISAGTSIGLNAPRIYLISSGSISIGTAASSISIGYSNSQVYIKGSRVNRNTIAYKNSNGQNASMKVLEWI